MEIRVQLHVLCIQLDKETSRATSAAVSSSSRTSQPLLTMPSVVDVDDAHTSLSALNSSSEYAKDEDVPLEERILIMAYKILEQAIHYLTEEPGEEEKHKSSYTGMLFVQETGSPSICCLVQRNTET